MPGASPGGADDPFANSPYQCIRPLGEGVMGEVYLVEHRHLHSTFVAKIMRAELAVHPQVVDRMRLEAQTLGRLNHPNIVSVAGFGTSTDARPFLVMEHLRGHTLREEIEARGSLPLAESVRHLRELLSGLSAAHALGIVHRDIKPDNLFLATLSTGANVLKILDFGIARVLPGAPSHAPRPLSLPTATGEVIGTPRFLSPEAAVGVRVDTRADLYAAALVFYTMLTGRGPFDHVEDYVELMEAHAREAPPPPSTLSPVPLPPGLDLLVLRALAKDPTARFQTAEALAAELARVTSPFEVGSGGMDTTHVSAAPFSTPYESVPYGARTEVIPTAPPARPAVSAPAPAPPRAPPFPPSQPSQPEPFLRSSPAPAAQPVQSPRFVAPTPSPKRKRAPSRSLLVGLFLLGVVVSAMITITVVGVVVGAH